jgi:DGQHR domain-containing protein
MSTVERPALVEVQRGQAMVSTTLTPGQLDDVTVVDIYNPDRGSDAENGYQRKPSTARITQAAAFYGEGVENRQGRQFEDRRGLMPNPIIANIRPGDGADGDLDSDGEIIFPKGVEISFNTEADRARITHAMSSGSSATANATILLTDGAVAQIVDGQHRGGAVRLLHGRGRLGEDFPVPIKIMLGFPRTEEIKQFYYINSQAKNVPTDLTAELLQRLAKQDSAEADYLSERKNKGSLLAGAAIYDALVRNDSPWLSRIRRPNESASKDVSIAVSQFIASLSVLQSAQVPRTLTPDEWARVIDALWTAVERLLPKPFEPGEQPGNWVLFKATGVNVMHRILADCLPIIIQRGGRLADPDQYEQLLTDLPSLAGIGIDPVTGEERQIDGAEFWRSSSIASQFTGRYGVDRLVGMIRGLIAKSNQAVTI